MGRQLIEGLLLGLGVIFAQKTRPGEIIKICLRRLGKLVGVALMEGIEVIIEQRDDLVLGQDFLPIFDKDFVEKPHAHREIVAAEKFEGRVGGFERFEVFVGHWGIIPEA